MKTVKTYSKRGLALLLALIMCVGMLNLTAFAADSESRVTTSPFAAARNLHSGDTLHGSVTLDGTNSVSDSGTPNIWEGWSMTNSSNVSTYGTVTITSSNPSVATAEYTTSGGKLIITFKPGTSGGKTTITVKAQAKYYVDRWGTLDTYYTTCNLTFSYSVTNVGGGATYTVTYYDGDEVVMKSTGLQANTVHTIQNYSKTGYTLSGWSKTKGSTTVTYVPNDDTVTVNANLDLYAVWKVCTHDWEDDDYANHKCKDCGETEEHNWSDWAVRTPATTEAAGEEARVCEDCGREETREIPQLTETQPNVPTYKELQDIFNVHVYDLVRVDGSDESLHGTKDYELLPEDEGGYSITGVTQNDDGAYVCTVTVPKAPYVDLYNKDVTVTEHQSSNYDPFTVKLTYQDGKWYVLNDNGTLAVTDNLSIGVRCPKDDQFEVTKKLNNAKDGGYEPGDTVVWKITIKNNAAYTKYVNVSDILSNGENLTLYANAKCTTVKEFPVSINSGKTLTLYAQYVIPEDAEPGTVISNTVEVKDLGSDKDHPLVNGPEYSDTNNEAKIAETETEEHTVTFKPENGQSDWTETVEDGQSVNPPSDPTRDGYTFAGWYDEDGNEYDFDTPVTQDITLIAHWTENNPGDDNKDDGDETTTRALTVVKTVDQSVADNEYGDLIFEYNVTVINTSGVDLHGLKLTDVLTATFNTDVLAKDAEEGVGVKLYFMDDFTVDGRTIKADSSEDGMTHELMLLDRSELFKKNAVIQLKYTVVVELWTNDKVTYNLDNTAAAWSWFDAE